LFMSDTPIEGGEADPRPIFARPCASGVVSAWRGTIAQNPLVPSDVSIE
jgi:hypothetical protein